MTFAEIRALNFACQMLPSHKLVLLTIATYANERGEARPERASIVRDTGLSDRRLREVLRDLANAGFLLTVGEGWRVVFPVKNSGGASPEIGGPSPQIGGASPESVGGPSPQIGGPSPEVGGPSPFLLYKGEEPMKSQEEPVRASPGEAKVIPFADEAERVEYRGSLQPLSRLAWAERTARQHVANLGHANELAGAELRQEWQAFLVMRAERARAVQPPMLSVDQAVAKLREVLKGGGLAFAVDAVRYAVAVGAPWPVVPQNRLKAAKVSATETTPMTYANVF